MTGEVAVLSTRMHPWGKWGRGFVEYGVAAARAALSDAGIDWRDVGSIVGADTVRGGYPGYVAGATFARALGWQGARVASVYAACASGAQALAAARAQILSGLADVVLVVGADAAPKGFFRPAGGDRPDDPDWLRFRALGATNPTYFGLYARRRMFLHGDTLDDFAQVKVKNAAVGALNPNARYRKRVSAEERRRVRRGGRSAAAARHLRDLGRRSGRGAVPAWSQPQARRVDAGAYPRGVHGHAPLSQHRAGFTGHRYGLRRRRGAAGRHLPCVDHPRGLRGSGHRSRGSLPGRGLRPVLRAGAASGTRTWGMRGEGRGGEAAAAGRRDDRSAGRIPGDTEAGGLGAFGEAVPAQAIAQVCELTWQLRGEAGDRARSWGPTCGPARPTRACSGTVLGEWLGAWGRVLVRGRDDGGSGTAARAGRAASRGRPPPRSLSSAYLDAHRR